MVFQCCDCQGLRLSITTSFINFFCCRPSSTGMLKLMGPCDPTTTHRFLKLIFRQGSYMSKFIFKTSVDILNNVTGGKYWLSTINFINFNFFRILFKIGQKWVKNNHFDCPKFETLNSTKTGNLPDN